MFIHVWINICLLAFPLCVHGANTTISGTTSATNDSIDISAVVDDFIETWKSANPDLESSQLDQILASAKTVKDALLNPPSKVKRNPLHTAVPRQTPYVSSHRRQLTNSTLSGNSTLDAARALVLKAQNEANIRNRERFRNPRLNSYLSSSVSSSTLKARAEDIAAFTVNDTVKTAAALVAEADATLMAANTYKSVPADILALKKQPSGTDSIVSREVTKRASGFWMEDIEHQGRVPFGGSENDDYVVFRNVKDYGAMGDGVTDDTEAIMNAMTDGNRCGANCGASTVKPAILYFPGGTYLISSPIEAYYNTQMIGNPNNRPVLKAASSFVGLGVVSSDFYTGGNGGEEEWFINQNNFLRQLRNFVIDVRSAAMTDIAGVHWQVAQATSIQNCDFYQSEDADTNQIGIFAENGSGGFMSDLIFWNGAIGIRCGNQQFTTRDFIFIGCRTGIDLLWDWGWTWTSMIISATENGISVSGDYRGGSIMLLDSYLIGTPRGIYVTTPVGSTQSEKFSITIDNLHISSVGVTVEHDTAGVTLAGGTSTIESWVLGKVYDEDNPTGKYQSGPLSAIHPKTEELMSDGAYFQRSKPQYEDYNANTFINARLIAQGDGSTDDTFSLSLMFLLSSRLGRPLYIPFGSYIVTGTVQIPANSRVVGECWAQIVAKGAYFADLHNPQVMVQVGEWGDEGVVEIQDVMFTTQGPTAGVILMEWNIAQGAQGSVAMWDSHFRIGGAKGSQLTSSDCPKLTGSVNSNCIAGTMMLHLTQSSSGYLENVWAWVADHDFDSGVSQTQIDIYVARGVLIESQGGPLWLYGTASEHAVFYQYLVYGAKNVFMGTIQTESPYYLPNPQAPAPFTDVVGQFPGDPDFSDCSSSTTHCAASWGLIIKGATNVHIFGAGLYNWFQAYVQPCVDTQDCQQRVVNIDHSGNVWLYNLYTIGTVEMLNYGSDTVLAKDNTNTNEHPFTSALNAWLVASSGEGELPLTDDGEYLDDLVEEEEVMEDENFPRCTAKFNTLAQITDSKASIPSNCFDTYVVDVLLDVLNTALHDYVDIVSNGYADKFAIYQRATAQQVPAAIDAYMSKAQASGNFRCTEEKYVVCCKDCSGPYGGCQTCDLSSDCVEGKRDSDIDCPTVISDPYDILKEPPPKYTYVLLDENKFHSELLDQYGVESGWFTLTDRLAFLGNGCQYAGDDVEQCIKDTGIFWHNYPVPGDIDIPDPSDVISKSYDNSKVLYDHTRSAQAFAPYDLGVTSHAELVDALSLPAMTMSEAVASMKGIVAAADKIIEEQRKEDIVNFITAIFMLVPVAGETAAAVGGATMRAIIGMAGELANVGMTIFELVDDPNSALTTIFGFLLGGGISRQPFKEAAAARRGMSSTEMGKMAPRIKTDLTTINDLRTMCLKK